MAECNVIAGDKAIHHVSDAHPTSSLVKELAVEFWPNGLTIKTPSGECIIVDLSFNKFNIYRSSNNEVGLIHSINAEA
jgi:hypothetical protein